LQRRAPFQSMGLLLQDAKLLSDFEPPEKRGLR
jgi:hypothetical protein